MLATKRHPQATPRQHKLPRLAAALDTEIGCHSSSALDLKLLQELGDRKILDRLMDIFQTVRAEPPSQDRAIRLPEVLHLLGIGKSTWYERLNSRSPAYDPLAPLPFKLGKSFRSPSVWWHSEVIAYLEARAAASRAH